jgi:glutamine amidotransferase
MQVAVIDYGMGNTWSVISACNYLGVDATLMSEPEEVSKAECLILPGVGSFRKAMVTLRCKGIDQAILEAVKQRGINILGICLGMQLLGSVGTEDNVTEGLGLIPNRTDRFMATETENLKVPHIGFNSIDIIEYKGIFLGLPEKPDFYFVHSYHMLPEKFDGNIGLCTYGVEFLAAFEKGNIVGTQFHPEKSQTNGLMLLKNFLLKN